MSCSLVSLAGKSSALIGVCVLMLSMGCRAVGVGDPCIPETVSPSGFRSTEIQVEASSVQCRTRVCLTYRLEGRPDRITGTPSCRENDMTCVSEAQRDTQIFCSCRCRAVGDSTVPLCTCPDAFHCVDLVPQGGDAVRGGYCIPEEFCERNSDCAAGERCNANACVTDDA